MSGRVLLYGVTGFSGRAVAEALLAAGHDLVVAGRDPRRVAAAAAALGAPSRVFGLDDEERLNEALRGIAVVLHAAGPFIRTAEPMMAACLRAGVHYLDLSGEWPTYARALRLGEAAARAGSLLLPGVGWDIAVTDALMARAARAAPEASLLRLAIGMPDIMSRGSYRSALGLSGGAVIVRREGEIETVAPGSLRRTFDFGSRRSTALAIGWPDVITGQRTTGLRNIEAYLEATPAFELAYRATSLATEVYGADLVRKSLAPMGALWPARPSPGAQVKSTNVVVVEAVDPWRRTTRFALRTLDGYSVTAMTATAIVGRVLAGDTPRGFQTPSALMGPDFVLDLGCAWLI